MKKIISIVLLMMTFNFSAHAQQGTGISIDQYRNLVSMNSDVAVLLFDASKQGVTLGHYLIEIRRVGIGLEGRFTYYCQDNLAKLTGAQLYEQFNNFLELDILDGDLPLVFAVVTFLGNVHGEC